MRLPLWQAGAAVCLSSLVSTSLAIPQHQQVVAMSNQDASTLSVTLVDVLSSDKDFGLFIRLLQKARLIPTLNKLHNATVFAPTNDAVKARIPNAELALYLDEEGQAIEIVDSVSQDNLQYRLRERLFYHMLNYSLIEDAVPQDGVVSLETTLLYPTSHDDHGRPGHVPYPAPDQTLLGGEGQKLGIVRSSAPRSEAGSTGLLVGVDNEGKDGSAVLSGRGGIARNGRVMAIDKMLKPPKSLYHQVHKRASEGNAVLSKFAGLLTEDLQKSLRERSHITLFAPTDQAFDALDPLEWKYLQSGFANDDIIQIASNHESEQADAGMPMDRVGYLDKLIRRETIPLLSGDSVNVVSQDNKVTVNGSIVSTANILASNGVMHIVDSLLLPHGSLALTPEKYLLALNATRFVSLFRAAGLSELLQTSPHNSQNNASYTILATRDDILERYQTLPWQSLPPEGSEELKETLQYHVLEGRWTKKQLRDGQLLQTMLRSQDLGNSQQRIPVSVDTDSSGLRSAKGGDASYGEIGFASASVISEPIQAGNSIIYLISKILEPPSSIVATSLDKGLSTFVASMYASELDKSLKNRPATTFLVPKNSAFDYLGLAMNYFLLPSAREDLEQLLRYHAVKGIEYIDELPYDSQHFETVEGSDVYLERGKNTTSRVHVRGPRVGGFPANGDNRDARIVEGDLLTKTGVLHIIDQVEYPPTINITSEKLMRGAKASTFPDLLRQTNLSWIAEGREAPADFFDSYEPFLQLSRIDRSKIKKRLFAHDSYTLLCPTDRAFTRINLTHYLNDVPALLSLVQLHIIPSPPPSKGAISDPMKFPTDGKPLALADDSTFSTLLSKNNGGSSKYGDVAFKSEGSEGDWIVGIKGATGTDGKRDNARVVGYGRNTPRFLTQGSNEEQAEDGDLSVLLRPRMSFGGGVLLIDTVLEPYEPTWLHRWGYIAISVILCLAAVVSIATLSWKLYDRRRKQASQYEALRQENEED